MKTRTHFRFENSLFYSNKHELRASLSEIMHDLSLLSDGQTTCTLGNQAKTPIHQFPSDNNKKMLHSNIVSGILGFATFLCEGKYSEKLFPLDSLILKKKLSKPKAKGLLSTLTPLPSLVKQNSQSSLERSEHHCTHLTTAYMIKRLSIK